MTVHQPRRPNWVINQHAPIGEAPAALMWAPRRKPTNPPPHILRLNNSLQANAFSSAAGPQHGARKPTPTCHRLCNPTRLRRHTIAGRSTGRADAAPTTSELLHQPTLTLRTSNHPPSPAPSPLQLP